MKKNYSISTNNLLKLWSYIKFEHKIQLFLVLGLMVIASFAEIVSLGATVPFLSALTSPEKIATSRIIKPLINVLKFESPKSLILFISVCFGALALVSSIIKLILLRVSTRVSFKIGAFISGEVYRKTLYQPYETHINRNSSDIIDGISTKANNIIYQAINPVLTIISSIFLGVSIVIVILIINFKVAISTFLGFGFIYFFFALLANKKLKKDGKIVATFSVRIIKIIQEGLGGIRDILLDGTQMIYTKEYLKVDSQLRKSQGDIIIISQSPRFWIEGISMSLLAYFSYKWTQQENGISGAIPLLGVIALGAQRLLPLLQQGYQAWTTIKGAQASISDTVELLKQPVSENIEKIELKKITYSNELILENIFFKYYSSDLIIKGISLKIKKGTGLE